MDNIELLLTILGTFMSVLCVPQLFGRTWSDVFASLFHSGISWKKVETLTSKIVTQMKDDGPEFKPDLIIGVGRGGIISAGLLCSTLINDGRQSKTIRIETVNTIRKENDSISRINSKKREVSHTFYYEVQKIDFDLSVWNDKCILVVIGETITGQTLSSMKKQIGDICKKNSWSINVKFATLALHDTRHNNTSSFEINYIGRKYKRKIKMPWKY